MAFVVLARFLVAVAVVSCVAVADDAASGDDTPKSYYDILEIKPEKVSASTLRRAYRNAALNKHPDKFQDKARKRAAETEFIRIAKAYKVLGDPMMRKQYDELLKRDVYDWSEEAVADLADDMMRSGGYGFGAMDFDAAEAMFEEANWSEEQVSSMLGTGILGTILLCVIPILYGAGVGRKAKPKGQRIKEKLGSDRAQANRERQLRKQAQKQARELEERNAKRKEQARLQREAAMASSKGKKKR